jgi:serine/threonine protein kinase
VKFIDFGTARDFENPHITGSGNGMKGKRVYEHFVGTPQFMAPECIRNKDSTKKSDVYSLGCLFYQLICGRTPYVGKTDYLVFTAVRKKLLTLGT